MPRELHKCLDNVTGQFQHDNERGTHLTSDTECHAPSLTNCDGLSITAPLPRLNLQGQQTLHSMKQLEVVTEDSVTNITLTH